MQGLNLSFGRDFYICLPAVKRATMLKIRTSSLSAEEALARKEITFARELAPHVRPTVHMLTIRMETCKDRPSTYQEFAYFPCEHKGCGFATKYEAKLTKHKRQRAFL